MSDIEWWYCQDCNFYGSKKLIMDEHFAFNHLVKKREPLEKRLIYQCTGEPITVKVEDKIIRIIPLIEHFRSSLGNPETYKFPELSLMHVTDKWESNGWSIWEGDIKNLAKKLTHNCGEQSCYTSEQELLTLFKQAIEKSLVQETDLPNVVVVRLTLSTSLEGKKPDETSHWVVCTQRQIEQLARDEEKIDEKVRANPKIYDRREIDELR